MDFIGKDFSRVEGLKKALGKNKYPSDIRLSHMLILGVKRSEIPHGEIVSIDFMEALNVPGVKGIFTSKDVPGTNRFGIVVKDQEVLCEHKVRCIGDPICLVAGESKEAVKRALSLIKIEYKPLPIISSIEEALKNTAPKIHEKGNILHKIEISKGNVNKAFKDSYIIEENTYRVPFQDHMPLETEAGCGYIDEDGKICIIAGTQSIYRDKDEISQALNINKDSIRVCAPFFGGGFGRKDGITVQILIALAVMKLKKPVRLCFDRTESINSSYHRHSALMKYKTGALKDGTINAVEAELYFDKGAYASLGAEVLNLAVEHFAGPYKIENTHVTGYAVYTNNPMGGAFRGFGVPQVTFAFESQMDIICRKLKMDQVDLRIKNAVSKWDKSCIGHTFIYSTGIKKCLEIIKNSKTYKNKEELLKVKEPFKKRGFGIAASYQGGGLGANIEDYAMAKIVLNLDGTLTIFGGISDMGQGNISSYVQMACEILSMDKSLISILTPDSKFTLNSGAASASRSTYIFGKALEGALNILKTRILKKSSEILKVSGKNIILKDGKAVNENMSLSYKEISEALDKDERIIISYADSPVAMDGHEIGHGLPHIIYSHAVHFVIVEVDTLTGVVKIIKYLTATECGKVINPKALEGQIQGGSLQGIGYGLYEGLILEEGKVINNKFSTYLIPGIKDAPRINCLYADEYETTGAFGMKGAGEISMDAPAPALSNALYDAVLYRSFSLPITSEKVLMGMKG